jgi:hypothetical protein
MWTYEHAKDFVVSALRRDAAAQETGRVEEIGADYDEFDENLPRDGGPEFDKLHIALWFWDEWVYARDHQWRTPVPARERTWPRLARSIAAQIEADMDVTDPAVLSAFGFRER